jgi:hypothetical protein
MGRAMMKLVRHGNGTVVGICRPMLYELGWICGQDLIVELLEDKSGVIVRRPRIEDFGPTTPPRLVFGETGGAR